MLSIIITNSQLKLHEKVCKKKDFCGNVLPTQKNNVSEFNQYMKSDKMQYIIYVDIESLIQKMDNHKNNLQQQKWKKYIPCAQSISTIWGFDHIENRHSLCRRKEYMRRFCESLR